MKRSLRILLLLLGLGSVFGLPPAFAGGAVTIGFVPAQGMIRETADAQAFGDLLSAGLQVPVNVRLLDTEEELHNWLSRYREVDFGWLSEEFQGHLPAGEVLPLAAAESVAGGRLNGLFVARQGLDAKLLQQLIAALLAMGDTPQGGKTLALLGVARIVAISEEPRAALVNQAPAQPTSPAPVVVAGVEAAGLTTPLTATAEPDPTIALAADRLDYDGESKAFQASGAVLLQQGETSLAADELLWQETTRDAAASGHIRLTEPGAELDGSSLHANLASGRGLARDGRVFLRERNFHLAGAEVERLGEATYRVTDGRFTTCDGEVPDWQFTAGQVDVTLGRYAVARDVWFEVRNQPLLYLPYLLFPVKSERESGFLLPRAGYSSRKGALLSLAWYEVIDRHLDATVYLDYLSRLGLGKGVEYRYALGADSQGQALFYHVGGIDDTPDSYALTWQHDGTLPGQVRLAAEVEYVSRREYFEDFGETADEYNRDQTVSTILLQRNWEKLNLTGHARYIKDLENDNDATLQRLPELGLDVPFFRLEANPLFSRTELRATNFWREEGDEGQRLYLRQGLGLVLKPGSWLEFTPEVAVYGRTYHAESGDEADLLPEYAATLSTRMTRVFHLERWGIERLQHSIEPQLRYVYIPSNDQDDLPRFDLKDRIGPLNLVEYALINRFTARSIDADGAPTYRELLNLRLSQRYDIREDRSAAIDDPEPFSDLRTELAFYPTIGTSLAIDALINTNDGVFSRLSAGAGYADGHGNGARIDYSYRSEESGFDATDYLSLQLDTALLAPVYASFLQRYDFIEGESLENVLNLEYRAQCWSLFLTYRDRQDSEEILVSFALTGLGRVGGFGSKLPSQDEQR